MESLIEAFTLPRWIEAKPGCIDGAGAWAKKFGTRAFVCTGRSAARKAGLLERVEKSLTAESLEYEIFDSIPAEPLLEIAEQGAMLAKKKACDVFIGLGGGGGGSVGVGIGVGVGNSSSRRLRSSSSCLVISAAATSRALSINS